MRNKQIIINLVKRYWVEILLMISIVGIHFYLSFSGAHYFPSRWFTRDDAYYYFKVAQNISEGYGSTFDRINLSNGYHPLWMLINIPIFSLARFDLILPFRVLMVVIGLISGTTSVMLYRWLRRHFHPGIAAMIAMMWGYSRNVHEIIYQQGRETGITALSMVGFMMVLHDLSRKEKLSLKDGLWFGFWGLILLLSRLDTLFLVLFGLIWLVFRGTKIQIRFLIEILLVYLSVIFAYILRVDLSMFLLAYDTTAIIFAGLLVIWLFVFNNLLGCYNKQQFDLWQELLRVTISIILSTLLASGVMAILSANSEINFSISVALLFIPIMTLSSLIFRIFLYRYQYPVGSASTLNLKKNWIEFRNSLRVWVMDGLKASWLIGSGFGLYAIYNQITFGTLMPISGQIKRWWGSSPDNVYGGSTKTIAQMFGVSPNYLKDGWTFINSAIYEWARQIAKWSVKNRAFLKETFDLKPLERLDVYWIIFLIFLALLLILFFLERKKKGRRISNSGLLLLLAASIFHILFYGATSYAAKHEWYWVSEDLSAFVLLAWIIQVIFDQIKKIPFSSAALWGIALIVGANALFEYQKELISRMPMQDLPASTPYIDMAVIMEEHTPPGSLIGMTGGGNVGYFIRGRTIMNMDGLINSMEYFEALKSHQAGEFYQEVGLDYIFANRFILTETAPYSFQISREDLQQVESAPTYGNKKLLFYDPK